MRRRFCLTLLLLSAAVAGAAVETVRTPSMELEFEDGWLLSWTNVSTGERVVFGREPFENSKPADHPTRPGHGGWTGTNPNNWVPMILPGKQTLTALMIRLSQ